MPNKFRVLFLFEGPQDGWSETAVFDSASPAPGGLNAAVKAIAAKRAAMLGRQYTCIGARIRLVQDAAGNAVKRKPEPIVEQFVPNQTAANDGDPDFVAALAYGHDAVGQNTTRTFFGGVPDAVTESGGGMNFNKPSTGAYVSNFGFWKAAMLGQTNQDGAIVPGYFTFAKLASFSVSGYAANASSIVTYTVSDGPIPIQFLGFTWRARVSGLNGGRSLLNREQMVNCLSDTTFATTKPRAAIAFSGPGKIVIYDTVPTFVALVDWTLAPFAARHKRGRPFSHSAGRLPARPVT